MLKKENRLSSNFEFNITRKHGEKVSHQLFDLFYLVPDNYEGPVKIGIVTSNKLAKTAVKRNRIKRVFREAVRSQINNLPDNLWIVIHPKVKSLDKNYEEISSGFDQILQKISLS
jgi:ribonuclease P protein component